MQQDGQADRMPGLRRLLRLVLVGALTALLAPATAGAATFESGKVINVPEFGDSGPADLYPSPIEVKGMPGVVTRVRVGFGNAAFSSPDDIDALLVGPGGQRSLLMSDACGTELVLNVFYAFDDSAGALMSDAEPCGNGLYRPVDYPPSPGDAPPADSFPAPAPAAEGGYAASLSVFDGADPNGVWELYVVDDSAVGARGGGGMIGWSIQVEVPATCKGKDATLVGANGRRDFLDGGPGPDVMVSLGGDDFDDGGGGADVICGGRGKDILVGGRGKDILVGGPGKDKCAGGPGEDALRGCEKAVQD